MNARTTRATTSGIIPVLMVAAPPTAWTMHLALSYWFVPVSCERGTVAPMHLTTAVAVAFAVAAALYGHRSPRSSTLGRLTLVLGVYFAGVIIMTGLVAVVVDPCA